MSYRVLITRTAENDLNEAVNYIEHVLFNPQAADDLLNEAEARIMNLASFPEKYSLVDDPVLHAWGIRLVTVKNYLVFFRIDESSQTVFIVRFLYGRRNWISILKKGVPPQ